MAQPTLLGLAISTYAAAAVAGPALAPVELQAPDYEVCGPWRVGDPVHETITEWAIREEKMGGPLAESGSDATVQFVRGVFWNDDPNVELLAEYDGLQRTTGLSWFMTFKAAEMQNTHALRTLLGRSHFGDLQFLHGMASVNEESATTTRQRIVDWAELAYKLSVGIVPTDCMLSECGLAAGKVLVANGPPLTAQSLFRARHRADARARALGTILHLLQDSYAEGHVERREIKGRLGAVVEFHSYTHQDHDEHAKADAWQGGQTTPEKIANLRGGAEALDASRRILAFYRVQARWEDVASYLEQGPLALDPGARNSGPGAAFSHRSHDFVPGG